jgi:CBS domain-containing protein
MAKYLGEIMNHGLFSVAPDDSMRDVRTHFRTLGIAGAPVLDERARPIGFVSLSDMVEVAGDVRVDSVMSSPADPIDRMATIEEAATKMAERNRHHLVVVDDEGRAVGYVGSLDIVRGLIGAPVPHPEAFRTYDPTTGATWSEEAVFSMEHVKAAPDGPGLLALIRTKTGEPDRVVWSGASHNVRTRAIGILSGAEPSTSHLSDDIEAGRLRFRAASTPSGSKA